MVSPFDFNHPNAEFEWLKDEYQSAPSPNSHRGVPTRGALQKKEREKKNKIETDPFVRCIALLFVFLFRLTFSLFSFFCVMFLHTVEIQNHRNLAKAKSRHANNVWHLFVYGKHNRRRQRSQKRKIEMKRERIFMVYVLYYNRRTYRPTAVHIVHCECSTVDSWLKQLLFTSFIQHPFEGACACATIS